MFGTELVKNGALSAAAPAEKSLAAGKLAHSAAMAGLRPRLRGSSGLQVGVEPTSQGPLKLGLSGSLSFPVVGIIWPMRESLSVHFPVTSPVHAFGSRVGIGLRLYARMSPVELSLNFRIPARRAADGTMR